MFRIVSKGLIDELQDQNSRAVQSIERLEVKVADAEGKYHLSLRELETAWKERDTEKAKCDILTTQVKNLEAKLAKLEASEQERNEMLEEMMKDVAKTDFSFLESSNPALLNELYAIALDAQRHVAVGSLKIRKVDGIAYRDGAFDFGEILKSKIGEIYKKATAKRKTGKKVA